MITKGPSRKQDIIFIGNENKSKFIETSSTHITNLNKVLRNIKSEVMANFICSDQADIIIVTNKAVLLLNLQTIEKAQTISRLIKSKSLGYPNQNCI